MYAKETTTCDVDQAPGQDCISRAVLIREGVIVGDCTADALEESGRDLMTYIKETYHYRAARVSRALGELTDGEAGEDG